MWRRRCIRNGKLALPWCEHLKNSLLHVADMVRASGGHIRRVIALGIIIFEIDTTQTAWVHGSKFDLDKLQNTGRDG